MPIARAYAVALFGIDGTVVEIEADIGGGRPKTQLLGLPDTALNEAKERVRAAIRNSGVEWPNELVTLGLSPAALPKGGSSYDLALACSVLVGAELVPPGQLAKTVLIGELALDGRVRHVRGVLPGLLAARREGLHRAVVPTSTLPEAALVGDMEVLGADRLVDVLGWLQGEDDRLKRPGPCLEPPPPPGLDIADVLGQPEARWALEVAAAGTGTPCYWNLRNWVDRRPVPTAKVAWTELSTPFNPDRPQRPHQRPSQPTQTITRLRHWPSQTRRSSSIPPLYAGMVHVSHHEADSSSSSRPCTQGWSPRLRPRARRHIIPPLYAGMVRRC